MASFKLLAGKALKNAIDKFATTATTFSETTHQLAASALTHVEEHSCASHLNRMFQATPLNYRRALQVWALHFGQVEFRSEAEHAAEPFAFKKGKSDLAGALEVSPADFAKAKNAKADKAFDEMKAFEAFLAKLEDKGGSARAVELVKASIRALKTPVADAAPVAAKPAGKPARQKPAAPVLVVENAPTVETKPEGWSEVEGGGEIVPAKAA